MFRYLATDKLDAGRVPEASVGIIVKVLKDIARADG
jgi:hypothetical protein